MVLVRNLPVKEMKPGRVLKSALWPYCFHLIRFGSYVTVVLCLIHDLLGRFSHITP